MLTASPLHHLQHLMGDSFKFGSKTVLDTYSTLKYFFSPGAGATEGVPHHVVSGQQSLEELGLFVLDSFNDELVVAG